MKWILNLSDMLSSLEIIILEAELKIQLAFIKKHNEQKYITNDETECVVWIPDRLSWKEFREIGAILNITSKYMNNINFDWS